MNTFLLLVSNLLLRMGKRVENVLDRRQRTQWHAVTKVYTDPDGIRIERDFTRGGRRQWKRL